MTAGHPHNKGDNDHHNELVEAEPALHKEGVERTICDKELIVEATNSAKQHSGKECPYIAVAAEVDTLLASRAAQEVERHDGQEHTTPLP